jgi:chloride channel 2
MSTLLSSNCVASLLQPSCYDSIIMIKKLPYLPDIIPSSSGAYSIFVEDFMMKVPYKYASPRKLHCK